MLAASEHSVCKGEANSRLRDQARCRQVSSWKTAQLGSFEAAPQAAPTITRFAPRARILCIFLLDGSPMDPRSGFWQHSARVQTHKLLKYMVGPEGLEPPT